jgi:hypothetical protein
MKGETSMRGEMDGQNGVWIWDEKKFRGIQDNLRNGIKSPTRTRFDSGVGGILLDMKDE